MSTAETLTTATRDAWNGATGERRVRHAERFDALQDLGPRVAQRLERAPVHQEGQGFVDGRAGAWLVTARRS